MAYVKDNLLNDLYETVLKLLSSKKDYDDFIYKSPFSFIAPDSEIIYSDNDPIPRKMTVADLMESRFSQAQKTEIETETEVKEVDNLESENGLLAFTEKEIIQMPKNIRKTFRIQGNAVHVRKRTDGRYKCSYEIRYSKKTIRQKPHIRKCNDVGSGKSAVYRKAQLLHTTENSRRSRHSVHFRGLFRLLV